MTWIALVFFITLCIVVVVVVVVIVLCAGCCLTLSSVASLVYKCMCTVSEMKLFAHVSIIMVYIFNLFHVLTVVHNGSSCFYFDNIEHCK